MSVETRPLTATRWIFAILGILLMLISGGATLYGLATLDSKMSHTAMTHESVVQIVLIIGGAHFLLGLLIWLLAVKVGR